MLRLLLLLSCSIFTVQVLAQQNGCDPKLWNYVYNEQLLHIKKSCLTIKGTVYTITNEKDGNLMLRIMLDSGQEDLINAKNTSEHYGCLPAMIICASKPKLPDAVFGCSGYTNEIYAPKRGAHVSITGSYVFNFQYGWYELHPVSEIKLIP